MAWLQALGFKINIPKSALVPSQHVQFLGFEIDSVLSVLRRPATKASAIKGVLPQALCRHTLFF